MIEYNFRQWLRRSRQFHYFGFNEGTCSGVVSVSLEENPIDQYTGVKDKVGIEIYENDIIQLDEYYSGDFLNPCEKRIIEFEDGSFNIDSVEIYNRSGIIIGNTYEGETK